VSLFQTLRRQFLSKLQQERQMQLTPTQIKHMDELVADELGAKAALNIALRFHANETNRLHKERLAFWAELRLAHGLDPDTVYTIRQVNGAVSIVEKGPDETDDE
jgi:1-aminocyclopropane-1-carboxylate deaminase/D-cysteine desulfhydrase-like pyridoxal-dependent ACC family enzyme